MSIVSQLLFGATMRTVAWETAPQTALRDLPQRGRGVPQDVAGLTRKFETSPVGGPTCRKTPISLSALEKNPRPGHLFEGKPVGEGTTRRGTVTVVHRPETPAGSTHSSTRGLRPLEHLESRGTGSDTDENTASGCVPLLKNTHCSTNYNSQDIEATCVHQQVNG